jgi:uncharacterized protein involved in exopolysaccharide biosynthesis
MESESSSATTPPGRGSAGVWYYISVLLRWYRPVLAFWIVGLALCALATLVLIPECYEAETVILPAESEGSEGMLSKLLPQSPLLIKGLGGSSTKYEDLFATILRSRTVADAIIDRFDLGSVYREDERREIRAKLSEDTRIHTSGEGSIRIRFRVAKDPELAVSVVREYLLQLERINRSLEIFSARRRRQFLATRVNEVRKNLEESEEALRAFSEEHGMVEITEQSRASIEAAGQLYAQIIELEAELAAIGRFATEEDPVVKSHRSRIAELQSSYQRILGEIGNPQPATTGAGEKPEIFATFRDAPTLGLQYTRLFRDVEMYNHIHELLLAELEQAKIDEANDTPVFHILDEPVLPESPEPGRFRLLAVGSVLVLVCGALLAFLLEGIATMRRGESAHGRQALAELKETRSKLGRDLSRIRNALRSRE